MLYDDLYRDPTAQGFGDHHLIVGEAFYTTTFDDTSIIAPGIYRDLEHYLNGLHGCLTMRER